ncbi:hypothetical protein A4S06_11265 [Erysipelotrichaceae bacterium MTC7]|nr:hypothetical protein A4S06_11265 [Erysipelotrichaceae bacterium MTC7]
MYKEECKLKPFFSLDEQIERLKTRGLTIADEGKAKRSLMCTNYYNLVNYYGKYLENDGGFVKGATFNELHQISIFDKRVRSTFLNHLIRIESMLKSFAAYTFCNVHREKYAYLNLSNLDTDNPLKCAKVISKMANTIQIHQKNANHPIGHYVNKYGHVPLWVLVGFIDFGTFVQFFESMTLSDKNALAKEISILYFDNYGEKVILTPEQLLNYLQSMQQLRNAAAHGNRLMSFKFRSDVKFHTELFAEFGVIDKSAPKQSIFYIFMVMKLFLAKDDFTNMFNSIRKSCRNLSNKLDSIEIEILMREFGFPNNFFENHSGLIKKSNN